MKTVAIIPARLASSRLASKVLLDINGKSMLRRVYERVSQVKEINEIIIATDHEKIVKEVESFGGKAIMTSKYHKTGTDRVAEVAAKLDADIIVNVQGDEPLIDPKLISKCLEPMKDSKVNMATPATEISPERAKSATVNKIVFDKNNDCLYVSRSQIPYLREKGKIYVHIGMYCYRRDFLLKFASWKQTPLEVAEALEYLRILENGYTFRVVETDKEPISVDTEEELEEVRKIIKKMES